MFLRCRFGKHIFGIPKLCNSVKAACNSLKIYLTASISILIMLALWATASAILHLTISEITSFAASYTKSINIFYSLKCSFINLLP